LRLKQVRLGSQQLCVRDVENRLPFGLEPLRFGSTAGLDLFGRGAAPSLDDLGLGLNPLRVRDRLGLDVRIRLY
jgi:hypothetical protein